MKTLIIAEAGVNHNGDFNTAIKMVDAAKSSGVDCIKFQTFKANKIASQFAEKADYQKINDKKTSSQVEMLKKLELSEKEFVEIKKYCDKCGIIFLSTPFDNDSIDFLEKIGIDFWKIPSGEVTNYPYLVRIAKSQKPVVMSTGMCDIDEIENAINVLKSNGTYSITLLHCTTEYPAPYNEVNLKAMETLKSIFGVDVGYSDHTKGIQIPIAAVAMGAKVIEKHFTLDRNMEGPDHKASLEPEELKEMVDSIRIVEKSIGDGKKCPTKSELKNRSVARKSIVASRKIEKGDIFNENNITTKRPGNGISPMMWNEVIGKKAIKEFEEDELIVL